MVFLWYSHLLSINRLWQLGLQFGRFLLRMKRIVLVALAINAFDILLDKDFRIAWFGCALLWVVLVCWSVHVYAVKKELEKAGAKESLFLLFFICSPGTQAFISLRCFHLHLGSSTRLIIVRLKFWPCIGFCPCLQVKELIDWTITRWKVAWLETESFVIFAKNPSLFSTSLIGESSDYFSLLGNYCLM